MRKVSVPLALAVAMFAGVPAVASDQAGVLMPIHQFVDGFNKGDNASALAACSDVTSIIDDFPPHEWHGAGACKKWADDYESNAKKQGIADGLVTLGKPRHVDVTADHAYVVIPSGYTFNENGEAVKQSAAFAFALQKGSAGWRITGWSWAKD